MKMRHPLVIVSLALSALFMAGCATNREAQTQSIRAGASLLSTTNAVPGSIYEVRVYVIERGDTVVKIARKFQISIADFETINPGLNPTRLKIGQEVRVSEKPTD